MARKRYTTEQIIGMLREVEALLAGRQARNVAPHSGCLLLALSGHFVRPAGCPLSGVKRTSFTEVQMSASAPATTDVQPKEAHDRGANNAGCGGSQPS